MHCRLVPVPIPQLEGRGRYRWEAGTVRAFGLSSPLRLPVGSPESVRQKALRKRLFGLQTLSAEARSAPFAYDRTRSSVMIPVSNGSCLMLCSLLSIADQITIRPSLALWPGAFAI